MDGHRTSVGGPSDVTSDGRPPPPPKNFRRQKSKCAESSETRFPQVSRLYDLISGGKRPFKVSHFWKMRNFEQPFTPWGWLRSASNFGETRFRWSPTFHFSTSKKKIGENFRWTFSSIFFFVGKSTNCLFLRSYGFLDVIGRCASKSYPQSFDFQLSTTFGGGVKEIVSIFFPTFGQKWLQPFSFFG